jgi:hypothetical protein
MEKAMTDELEGRKRGYDYPVNGVPIAFPDRVFSGREALTRSGDTPASEFQLVLARNRRTHLIGTDDDIDAVEQEGGELRAFPGDRSFTFTVDEVGQVWGAEDMEVDEFERIWPALDGYHWILEHDDEPDTVLASGGVLSFGPEGVEDIVSRKDKHPDKVLVMVVTTAGVFPAEGNKRYPAGTLISSVLEDAARKLHITAAPDWIVTVDGRDVNPAMSFEQQGLSGTIKIEWGPREGGGGA